MGAELKMLLNTQRNVGAMMIPYGISILHFLEHTKTILKKASVNIAYALIMMYLQ